MARSKEDLFNDELRESARLFKALAHPARLEIIKYLLEIKACMSGDFSEVLPLGRTTVNQHLKELMDAGLIDGRISGSGTRYCVDDKQLDEKLKHAEELIKKYKGMIKKCCP